MEDYSQYVGSKFLLEIFKKVGIENKYVVEFGISGGFWLSNNMMFINM